MTEGTKRTLTLSRSDSDDEMTRWLHALEDARSRTLERITGLPDSVVDQVPPSGGSTIGALLYHIAAIEADWLFYDILGTQETDWPGELFPKEVREDGNTLSSFTGETLSQHLSRLEKVRTMLVETVHEMSPEDLHCTREREPYHVSPAWVLHHLMQHEAEHRSQIGSVLEALGIGAGW